MMATQHTPPRRLKRVTLDHLPVSAKMRRLLQTSKAAEGAVVSEGSIVGWGAGLIYETEAAALDAHPDSLYAWRRAEAPSDPRSRVAQALALMQEGGLTANAAASKVGVGVAAVYRARDLRKKRGACPTCGQVLP